MNLSPRFLINRRNPLAGPAALVTGGAGFIGSNLCRTLLHQGWMVYCVDNFITGKRENVRDLQLLKSFKLFELDVVNPTVVSLFAQKPLTHVFHLACPTGVPNIAIHGEEMLLTSSLGTRHALEIARTHKAKFLFTSSAEVYGDPLEFPQRESYTGNVNAVGPRGAYEEGKRFGETLTVTMAKKHEVHASIVRIFNTYGPGMSLDDTRVIPQFIKHLLRNEPITIYGDGSQTRAHIFVDDLVNGLLTVARIGQNGDVYNIGGNKQTTIRELAELLMSISGRAPGITHLPHFIEDHQGRLPAVEKIEQLGWKQLVDLQTGLQRMSQVYGLIQPATVFKATEAAAAA